MNFAKVRTVKSPNRGTSKSAGIDFYVPQVWDEENEEFIKEFDEQFEKDLAAKNQHDSITWNNDGIRLYPHQRVMIPSGIHVNLEDVIRVFNMIDTPMGRINLRFGIMLTAHNKSGVGTKKGLDRLAEVVDEDYQGELHISVVNTSNNMILIAPGDKLIQFIEEPVILTEPKEVPIGALYTNTTERGDGGFGSTDEK